MRRVSAAGVLLFSVCVCELYLGSHYLQKAVVTKTTPAALVNLPLVIMSAGIAGYTAAELTRG
ncbi:hypothetical protein [Roseiconus lacunae]|uniref:Uncharacterized protein n=1 Tax=Roseiconus lacunae TaxID=2605694 RepID=A0ABT7PHM6_9BACT|nr:hypothetical protein [Roseiconus lacunae]MDM4015996.1 hypothetical protein [Roseiconus lacunae]